MRRPNIGRGHLYGAKTIDTRSDSIINHYRLPLARDMVPIPSRGRWVAAIRNTVYTKIDAHDPKDTLRSYNRNELFLLQIFIKSLQPLQPSSK